MAQIIKSEEELVSILKANKKVLVDFYADWCPPCKLLLPIINKLSETIKDCLILKVNTDNNPEIKEKYGIMSIPTLILFNEGKTIKENVGFLSEEGILDFIK